MKRFSVLPAALLCAASLTAAATAASMSPASRIKPWLGTWSCKAAGNAHTATFTPIFGGNGMRISETGKNPSEEIVTFDGKSGKWIDQYADSSGMYTVMQGTPSGKSIRFTQVYPKPGPVLTVMMPNSKMYTTTFRMMMNGKMTTQNETCTR